MSLRNFSPILYEPRRNIFQNLYFSDYKDDKNDADHNDWRGGSAENLLQMCEKLAG